MTDPNGLECPLCDQVGPLSGSRTGSPNEELLKPLGPAIPEGDLGPSASGPEGEGFCATGGVERASPIRGGPGEIENVPVIYSQPPSWVKTDKIFVTWMMQVQAAFKETGVYPSVEDVEHYTQLAHEYNVKVVADPGYPETNWEMNHLNIGAKGQAHIPLPADYVVPTDLWRNSQPTNER